MSERCPKCDAPARHMPPDGDFRYDNRVNAALSSENKRLRVALEEISKNGPDGADLTSENSAGNYDDVFSDGMTEGAKWAGQIARKALEGGNE